MKNLEIPANNGKNFNNSILSISDNAISSNLNNVGISLGSNENDIFRSISEIKSGEFDKIHANQIDRNAQDNCLDSSDEVEDSEIEYITLGHLYSGIIDELADEGANHIGGE
jgi:hypothetical protein